MNEDIAGRQYPHPELAKSLVNLCQAKYGEVIGWKGFSSPSPTSMGLWGMVSQIPIPFNAHVKMRLYDVHGFYVEDRLYLYTLKVRLHIHEARKVVRAEFI